MLTPIDGEPVFAEYYGSAALLDYVTHFIQRPAEQLSLGEFCIFSHPPEQAGHNGGWHRDATWWKESSGGDSKGRTADRLDPASYSEPDERAIWEAGGWDRRPGSPRGIAARGSGRPAICYDPGILSSHSLWRENSLGLARSFAGGVGFHLALVEDDCFELVPGSHKRFRTAEEKEAMLDYNGLGPGTVHGLTKVAIGETVILLTLSLHPYSNT